MIQINSTEIVFQLFDTAMKENVIVKYMYQLDKAMLPV